MKRLRFTKEQIIGILREQEAGMKTAAENENRGRRKKLGAIYSPVHGARREPAPGVRGSEDRPVERAIPEHPPGWRGSE